MPGGQVGRDRLPVSDRIVVAVDVAGAVDEVLVLRERHLRVLGVRLRREQRAAQRELARADALPAAVDHPVVGREVNSPPVGVNSWSARVFDDDQIVAQASTCSVWTRSLSGM